MKGLAPEFTPQLVSLYLPCSADTITAVEQELTDRAAVN